MPPAGRHVLHLPAENGWGILLRVPSVPDGWWCRCHRARLNSDTAPEGTAGLGEPGIGAIWTRPKEPWPGAPEAQEMERFLIAYISQLTFKILHAVGGLSW